MNGRAHRPGQLSLYLTGKQPCSYLPNRDARSLFIDPMVAMDGERYQLLLEQGFRRSGRFIYRPACFGCQACVSVRIPVAEFRPNRSQRRNQRHQSRLQARFRPAGFEPEHFALYRDYLLARHPDGTMAEGDEESYRRFLLASWGGATELMELRRDDRLIAVAVTDVLPRALSAVYTYFDPRQAAHAPGTHALLAQIAEAQRRGLAHLYLGYWIEACRKMRYKERYRPIEAWDGQSWRRYERGEPIAATSTADEL